MSYPNINEYAKANLIRHFRNNLPLMFRLIILSVLKGLGMIGGIWFLAEKIFW